MFYCFSSYFWDTFFTATFPTSNIEDKVASNERSGSPLNYILGSWVFENFIFAVKTFAKALWILETWVPVNNNLC